MTARKPKAEKLADAPYSISVWVVVNSFGTIVSRSFWTKTAAEETMRTMRHSTVFQVVPAILTVDKRT